ncbi:MAG TPA: hypothetical protein EYG78_07085 [Sulfurovum sp.]|nr:hypothetical protein [Sulfurovum sp.]
MNKKVLLLLATTLTLSAAQAPITFERTFGGDEDDVAKAVIQTDDGYLIAGKTKSFTSHRDYDAYLIKIDKKGKKLWSKVYGGEEDDEANALTAHGKEFVFVGSTESYGNDNLSYYFVKIDANGESLWQKSYFRGERDYYYGNDIVSDGKNLVIAGSERHLKFMSAKINPLQFQIDTEGDLLWRSYVYGDDEDRAKAIVSTQDGYMLAGSTESYGYGDFDAYLVKLDKEGKKVWFKTFGGKEDEIAEDIIATKDGYLLVGSTDSFGLNYHNVYVIKTDKEGKKIWERTYGGTYDDEAFAVATAPDGGYVIAGRTKTRRDGFDLLLLKIDENGKRQWERTYGGDEDDAAHDIVATDDGYLIVGEKQSDVSRNSDVWLLKVDLKGKL